MGRRRNNPDLVAELIDNIYDMDQEEFEEKYDSLSSSDQYQVNHAIDHMSDKLDKEISPGCAACGNPSYPYCINSCNLFD